MGIAFRIQLLQVTEMWTSHLPSPPFSRTVLENGLFSLPIHDGLAIVRFRHRERLLRA